MSIILVRHGETQLNVARTLQPADTPLSVVGLSQAEAVARRLALLGLSGILSSDLPRALRTSQAIANASGLPVVTSPLLRERNFGALRGRSYDDLGFDPLTMTEAPPEGESAEAFCRRVGQAFAHALQLRAALGGNLAVVTHGLVIAQMLDAHVCLAQGQSRPARIANTSVTVLALEPPHTVELLDCVRHLDELNKDDAHSLSGG